MFPAQIEVSSTTYYKVQILYRSQSKAEEGENSQELEDPIIPPRISVQLFITMALGEMVFEEINDTVQYPNKIWSGTFLFIVILRFLQRSFLMR